MSNILKQLEKQLQKKFQSALKQEVATVAVDTMQDNIDELIYDSYKPKMYERTGQLREQIDVGVIGDNGIYIENVRYENGRDIAEIVETGVGYQYLPPRYDPFDEDGNTYLKPRPFTEVTRRQLENGLARQAFEKGMRRQGIRTK